MGIQSWILLLINFFVWSLDHIVTMHAAPPLAIIIIYYIKNVP
jgi:hypothetical protein